MLLFIVLCASGYCAGWLLLRRLPTPAGAPLQNVMNEISIVIPARNEAAMLPVLLTSLEKSRRELAEIIVVDDQSSDATAAVAASFGSTVISAPPLPPGWTGKNWACHQGALATRSQLLLFLDADTFFVDDGLARIAASYTQGFGETALSVLPYHCTRSWTEQLSMFFNIVTAMAAGGFTGVGPSRLFGQSLLVSRALYFKSGGHAGIQGEILENLMLASRIEAAGGVCRTLGGRNILAMRMFPEGMRQMNESWRKGFAAGAQASTPLVLVLISIWIGGVILSACCMALMHRTLWAAAIYACFVIQVAFLSRQVGNFRLIVSLIYPVGMLYYLLIFAQSTWRRTTGKHVTWKGRSL